MTKKTEEKIKKWIKDEVKREVAKNSFIEIDLDSPIFPY